MAAPFSVPPATSGAGQPTSRAISDKAGNKSSANHAGTAATWFVATAACHHMTGDRSLIADLVPVSNKVVYTRTGSPMQVCGRGSVRTATVTLPDVWYVPSVTENLVSVGQLTDLDLSVAFGGGQCVISKSSDGSVIGKAPMRHGKFAVDFLNVQLN